MKRWIKRPSPGQFRGDGEWYEVDERNPGHVNDYEYCKETGYLPTAEQEERPED